MLKVVDRLLARKLYIDINKYKFLQTEVKYLGLIVGKDGIRMDPEKVSSIVEWEAPKNVKDVQTFLGFANFYRRFIRSFSNLTRPLVALTRGENF